MLRALGDDELHEVVEGYMDAMRRGDVKRRRRDARRGRRLVDAPLAAWFRGREALIGSSSVGRSRATGAGAAHANGQAAVGSYCWYAPEETHLPFALDVLTLDGRRIREIMSFITRSTEGADPRYYERWPGAARRCRWRHGVLRALRVA